MRGATPVAVNLSVARLISIHAPLAGCDASHRRDNARHGYFNPRTPCGVRRRSGGASARCARFQSTHPLRGATASQLQSSMQSLFQSTHPLRGATTPDGERKEDTIFQSTHPLRGATSFRRQYGIPSNISIHAPLAGCDMRVQVKGNFNVHFNPRTPCGVRLMRADAKANRRAFQSTHPLRGATWSVDKLGDAVKISIHAPLAGCDALAGGAKNGRIDFNPRTPCGVRPGVISSKACGIRYFNPRTPCGVRRARPTAASGQRRFQSTHPLRGATRHGDSLRQRHGISIHAPLAGCDAAGGDGDIGAKDFNPRTPCGVRLQSVYIRNFMAVFQSTHPLRGATSFIVLLFSSLCISIHAPLAGCDALGRVADPDQIDFNPRTPCGVRRSTSSSPVGTAIFQSTHPLRGATLLLHALHGFRPISIHAPLAGCDDTIKNIDKIMKLISIHAPLAGCDQASGRRPSPKTLFQSTHPLRGAT